MRSLNEFLGVELPIIQAPMAGIQGAKLATSVSRAGGLGSLPCATLDEDSIRLSVASIRAETDCPFNMNFFCHQPAERNQAVEAAWQNLLTPYFIEYQLDPSEIQFDPGFRPFGPGTADLLEELRPPVVSFHFGLPAAELLARVKATGAVVMSSATTVDEALDLEARGVDVIIAQGLEAGGHRGNFLSDDLGRQAGTISLVPQVVRAVKIPVVAAGGIATPSAVSAARVLGASGVQVGTAYLLCPESDTSTLHRAAVIGDGSRHTEITRIFSGRPARAIANRFIRELGAMDAKTPAFPLGFGAIAPVRAKAESQGVNDFSSLWAGQSASDCREISAADLTRDLAQGFSESTRTTESFPNAR